MKRRLKWINVTNYAWATCVCLALVWLLNAIVAERTWWTWLAHSLPQSGYLFFPIVLLVAATLRKRWSVFWLSVGVIALFPFVFMGFTWGRPLDPLDGDLKVATYNIHGGESPIGPIQETIKQIDVDVLCVQESGEVHEPGLMSRIASEAGFPYSAIKGELAVLSKYPIVRVETVVFEGSNRNRDGIEATITYRGRLVTVLTVHLVPMLLDYALRDGFPKGIDTMRWVSQAGRAQAQTIARRYRDWPHPVVVAGDHNFNPSGVRYRTVDAVFDDAFALVGRGFGYTIPSDWPVMRIDYVWVKGLRPVTCAPFPSTSSDHKPLVARLRIEE